MRDQGWEYQFAVTYVEIYNETIRDLLRAASPSDAASAAPLVIRHHGANVVDIPGLVSCPVTTAGDVELVMTKANRAKQVSATAMNAQSSRSHCVFTLNIVGA